MARRKVEVIISEIARKQILKIVTYIEKKGYPLTAEKLANRMVDFALSLGLFPDKYSVCRFRQFAKRGYHCAVFEENYIFVYNTTDNQVNVLRVVSCKKMKS